VSLQSMKRRAQGFQATGEKYERQDLRSLSSYLSNWTNCAFTDCEMGLADLNTSKLTGVVFNGCRLYGSNFNMATLTDVSFIDCDLEQASFRNAVMRGVSIGRTRGAYSSFAGATMKTVRFWKTNLHGADLDFVEGKSVEFDDCNLWSAKASFGCAFYSSTFDETSAQRFAAMLGRVYPTQDGREKLKALAGFQFRIVDRLMKGGSEERAEE
jgi:uncharacterized protein YjbI with pentapeptide repeats